MAGSLDHIDTARATPPSVNGRRRDPVVSSSFIVTISDLGVDYAIGNNPSPNRVSFSKITGIGSSIKTIDVVQGTSPVRIAVPSGIAYDDVTFERGFTTDKVALSVMSWYQDVKSLMFSRRSFGALHRSGESNVEGVVAKIKRRRVEIELTGVTITLVDAWPVAAKFGDIDASSGQVWIYSMTMKYRGIEVKPLAYQAAPEIVEF